MTARKLGEFLVSEGRISQAGLTRALELQGAQARGLRLGAILLRCGLLSERGLLESLSMLHRCPAVDWGTLSAARPEALDLITSSQSARLGAVPYAIDGKSVRVAFADPSNLASIDEVQAITGKRVIAEVTTEIRLLQAQQRFYKRPLGPDTWMIVQKIEMPAPPPPIASAPPPAIGPPNFWAEPGAKETGALAPSEEADNEPAVEELVDAAPAPDPTRFVVAVPPERLRAAQRSLSVLAARTSDSGPLSTVLSDLSLAETLSERSDLFSDDTSLVEFIEQALSYCEAHPTFHSALAALGDESIEDLEAAPGEERPQDLGLDSTLPSGPRRRPKYGPGLRA